MHEFMQVGRINRRAEAKGLDLKVLKLTFSGGCMEILELNKEIDLRCPAGPTIGSSPSKLKIGKNRIAPGYAQKSFKDFYCLKYCSKRLKYCLHDHFYIL